MLVRSSIYQIILLIIFGLLVMLALLIPFYGPLSYPTLKEGDVASQDIIAPSGVTFESEVLTENSREAAARAVESVYSSPDTSTARQQLERLRASLAYITAVRGDSYASHEQKLTDLAALEDIQLDRDTTSQILALSDTRWQIVQQEAILVLEQVMRDTIREDRLNSVRRSVPTRVSLSLPEDQAEVVVELVTPFVIPNSFFNEDLTEAARQAAREAVEPETRTFVAGENVVQRGKVINKLDIEALQEFGFAQPENGWQDIASAIGLTIIISAFFVIYIRRNPLRKAGEFDLRGLTVLVTLFLGFLLIGRLTIPGHAVIPYIYPVMAFGLIVSSLYGAELALICSLPLSLFVAFGLPNALDLTIYYTVSSYFGILVLQRGQRVTAFIGAGAAIAVSGAVVAATFWLLEPAADLIGLITLVAAAFGNGIASASISILLQFLLAQILGTTTALQLIDLSRPDHPLMQFILRNSPGTYQHSLQLANLVEQAAEQIGADPLLSRVGALYHDAGKALNPFLFIENQVSGNPNPHNDLTPEASAEIIRSHVTDGLELARKYRLPPRIQDFIREHHGTMITRYQYHKAVEEAGGDESAVDVDLFRYPGPRPRSRETALLMLADGCEARMRAERPKDEGDLRSLIRDVIDKRFDMGQLNDTELTFKDMKLIVDSFTASLKGVYHPRIEYPKPKEGIPLSNSPLIQEVPEEMTPEQKESTSPS